ncbi:hypothetical protein F4808DRAFT_455675 [Astrocystis sublimbata]|nr:hypothetical protein F4808DRAFT_455675 [Astrocystis sublimbata]
MAPTRPTSQDKDPVDTGVKKLYDDIMKRSGQDDMKAAELLFERQEQRAKKPWHGLTEGQRLIARMRTDELDPREIQQQMENEEKVVARNPNHPLVPPHLRFYPRHIREKHAKERKAKEAATATATTSVASKQQAPVASSDVKSPAQSTTKVNSLSEPSGEPVAQPFESKMTKRIEKRRRQSTHHTLPSPSRSSTDAPTVPSIERPRKKIHLEIDSSKVKHLWGDRSVPENDETRHMEIANPNESESERD